MRPAPGDMIRIIQDAWGPVPDFLLVATKGSIARAMSIKEYIDYFNEHRNEGLVDPNHVTNWMAHGEQYPFMLMQAAPPSQAVLKSFHMNDCQAGKVVVLDARFFQIIDDESIDNTD